MHSMNEFGINPVNQWKVTLAHFLLPGDCVKRVEFASGGLSGAVVLRVEADSGLYALREWGAGTITKERIFELHRFLDHLSQFGLPVAVPLRAVSHPSTLIESANAYWQLEPWLPGTRLSLKDVQVSKVHLAMEQIARMHLAAEKYRSTPQGSAWFAVRTGSVPALTERIHLVDRWDRHHVESCIRDLGRAPEQLRKLGMLILTHYVQFAERIKDELQALQSTPFHLIPCWRDLRHEHVLFTGDAVTGIIDPAATRRDHPGTDVSRFLGSLVGDDLSMWKTSLTRYSQVRPLTTDDLRLIEVLDRSSVLLSGLTWLERWQTGAISGHNLSEVLRRLEGIERRMPQLALSRFES